MAQEFFSSKLRGAVPGTLIYSREPLTWMPQVHMLAASDLSLSESYEQFSSASVRRDLSYAPCLERW
jgi:hypothetical protein